MADGHSEFLVFVDESGDHGLESIDPSSPVFVLVFCILTKADYARHLLPALTELKFRHFGHDQIVLHEREIRKDLGDFSVLRDPLKKEQFLSELTTLVAGCPMTVIASVIRKDKLVSRYHYPDNPYAIALQFGLERTHRWLERNGAGSQKTAVLLECRGRREDRELELEFRRICSGGNYRRTTLPLEPRFVPKAANAPGLQLADLIARPIGRVLLDPNQANRAYEVIAAKLDRSPAGDLLGWGLKVFP